jgi:CRISPR-associated protein Cmr6
MFQAQIKERCQLQYAGQNEDIVQWTNEWTQEVLENPIVNLSQSIEESEQKIKNTNTNKLQKKILKISWRFVTNGGQDDGIIRPVIGKYGLPYYPGSSMKGAFCQACTEQQRQRYNLTKDADHPSLLRFHGGYPINSNWKEKLIDLTHSQQNFQVGMSNTGHSANTLISLYQPEIEFCISTTHSDKVNWDEIWQIWKKALGQGIGCRVSAGYGQSHQFYQEIQDNVLYQVRLHGQGAASKLLDGNSTPEFRPNMFRAGIRGHALRIFAGLNQSRAKDIIHELFGGIEGETKVGWLRMSFYPENDDWQDIDEDIPDQHLAYDITGTLVWTLAKADLDVEEKELLKNLIQKLTEFAMLLGGFGKSWRRADHKKFYPDYQKYRIGCHWEWVDAQDNPVNDLEDVTKSIKSVEKAAKKWMNKKGFEINTSPSKTPKKTPVSTASSQPLSPLAQPPSSSQAPALKSPPRRTQAMIEAAQKPKPSKNQTNPSQNKQSETLWREAWRSDNVEVWGRIAEDEKSSWVIDWLHNRNCSQVSQKPSENSQNKSSLSPFERPSPPQQQNQPVSKKAPQLTTPIYKTAVTGGLGNVGRLWHRMYPIIKDGKYLELITIFHRNCSDSQKFLKWLESQKSNQNSFQKLWSN